jgi:hypothetical protein
LIGSQRACARGRASPQARRCVDGHARVIGRLFACLTASCSMGAVGLPMTCT